MLALAFMTEMMECINGGEGAFQKGKRRTRGGGKGASSVMRERGFVFGQSSRGRMERKASQKCTCHIAEVGGHMPVSWKAAFLVA